MQVNAKDKLGYDLVDNISIYKNKYGKGNLLIITSLEILLCLLSISMVYMN